MKNIHEILTGYGLSLPEDKKAEFDRELAANYKTIADYEKQIGKIEQLTKDLNTAKEGLKAFEGVDVAELQGKIAKLQGDLDASDKAWQEKLAGMEFDQLLSGAITAAKGKNVKAISALLDLDTLRASKNQAADVKTALDQIKQESGYLFDAETPPPYAGGTGTKPPGDNTGFNFGFTGVRAHEADK